MDAEANHTIRQYLVEALTHLSATCWMANARYAEFHREECISYLRCAALSLGFDLVKREPK